MTKGEKYYKTNLLKFRIKTKNELSWIFLLVLILL